MSRIAVRFTCVGGKHNAHDSGTGGKNSVHVLVA